jgi:hypothetical protein
MLEGYNVKLKKKEQFEPEVFKTLKNGATLAQGKGVESGMKINRILSRAQAEAYKK